MQLKSLDFREFAPTTFDFSARIELSADITNPTKYSHYSWHINSLVTSLSSQSDETYEEANIDYRIQKRIVKAYIANNPFCGNSEIEENWEVILYAVGRVTATSVTKENGKRAFIGDVTLDFINVTLVTPDGSLFRTAVIN
jgi:hypothetical protein